MGVPKIGMMAFSRLFQEAAKQAPVGLKAAAKRQAIDAIPDATATLLMTGNPIEAGITGLANVAAGTGAQAIAGKFAPTLAKIIEKDPDRVTGAAQYMVGKVAGELGGGLAINYIANQQGGHGRNRVVQSPMELRSMFSMASC